MTRRRNTCTTVSVAFLTYLLAVEGGPHNAKNDVALNSHFQGLVEKQAHTFSHAIPLPLAAAGPILHVDLDLVSRKPAVQASFFEAILEEETAIRAAAASESRFPYVLCGPQSASSKARHDISAASGPSHRTQVVYSSRLLDVACWKGQLHVVDAIALESSDSFFHVAPVPKISKLAPGLVQRHHIHYNDGDTNSTDRLAVHSLAYSQGINIFFDPSSSRNERMALVRQWKANQCGLAVSSATEESFLPAAWAKKTEDAAPWVDSSASGRHCLSILAIHTSTGYSGLGSLLLKFKPLAHEEATEACLIAALLHLASSSNVTGLEVAKKMITEKLLREINSGHLVNLKLDNDRELKGSSFGNIRALNYIAVTALQSGSSSKPYPFWSAGINGSNQFVQVTDSGFDDASCFLRDTDASQSELKGPYNPDVQLARSTYDNPVTDFSRRKVVQYIMLSNSSNAFGYDSEEGGHGTHVAGTVAGSLASDEDNVLVKNSKSYCASYSNECDTYFCATCPNAHDCDAMCGFVEISVDDDFSGMAPSAKIMAYDKGDYEGGTAPPSDFRSMMYAPAYDAGARIFSNSWGMDDALYSQISIMVDNLIYDYDDALVVFAAGNSGDVGGDVTIGSPGTSKNAFTVGAAETIVRPDTVASFSSRGPTTDYRIKPDVCGPGNPIYSAASSGLPGNATCAVKPMDGTSMATPAVSGVAALLRQFLVDGMHEIYSNVGYAASNYNSSHPSSALLKAMLIGSTMPLTSGYDSAGNPVTLANFYSGTSPLADTAPYALGTVGVDYHQGFGHVLLSNVLSLDGAFDTFLYESSLQAYSSYTLEFVVASTATEIDITLVWTDPPGSEYCNYYTSVCLVHDLDLRVTHSGNRLYSNFGAASSGTYAREEDTQNNVEKTTIATNALSAGDILVVVVTTDNGLAWSDDQKFALVVTGNIERNSPTLSTTVMPTSEDTFTVALSMDMATNQSTISSVESNTLKKTIATTAGVDSTYIANFAVKITAARRRLLTGYVWAISFDVVAPLSVTSASSPTDFTDSMTTSLETNLATNIQTDMGLAVTISDVSTVIASRLNANPSPVPSRQPSVNEPFSQPTKNGTSSNSSISGATIGALVAGLVLYLFCAGVIFKQHSDLQKAKSDIAMMGDQSTMLSSTSNPVRNSSATSNVELTNIASTSMNQRPLDKPRAKLIGPGTEEPDGSHDAVL